MNFVYFSKNSVKIIFRFIDLKLRQLHTPSLSNTAICTQALKPERSEAQELAHTFDIPVRMHRNLALSATLRKTF